MSAVPTTTLKLMTADEFWEFCNLPENEGKSFELIRGEVVEMPSPTKRHGRVCLRIGYLLERFAETALNGYAVSNDSGVILEEGPDTVVGPDVAYFTDAKSFDDIHPKWSEEVPALAVEVLSPSDRMRAVLAKVGDYLRNGVRTVWLVNYEERFVTVFTPDSPPVTLGETDEITGRDALAQFTCRVGEFFRVPGELPSGGTTPSS
jgi:Uma2 family endonuclease